MIVLDASVLIGFIFEQDAHHDAAVALLRNAAGEEFGASSMTMAEVLVLPARVGRLPAAVRMLHELGVAEVPLPGDCAVQLAQLRADSGLKLPDCCVLLAALMTGGALATFDEQLASAAAARNILAVTS